MYTDLVINVLGAGGGLSELSNTLIDNWIAPAYLAGIALMSIIFIKDRAWMKLISFLGIAALVAIPIFFGDELFGGEGLSKVGSDLAKQVNAVDAYSPTLAEVLE